MAPELRRTSLKVDELIPELAPLGRRTTVLLPKSRFPGAGESSIGGPLLWPVAEPWPYCEQPGHWAWPNEKHPAGPAPMVPVVQLFARDVPELQWIHLRTTNPIESTFSTVKLRTKVTRGAGSPAAALAMVFKLVESAQDR